MFGLPRLRKKNHVTQQLEIKFFWKSLGYSWRFLLKTIYGKAKKMEMTGQQHINEVKKQLQTKIF